QVIETRQADLVAGVAPDADAIHPKYQNVWSRRYIDALILRDENTDPATDDQCDNGRIFYLADANFNVTAIVGESSRGEEDWAVRERYVYTPYGALTILDADFAPVPGNTSAHATTTLYTGRRLDAETGLYYYRARYYHAQLGRFNGRDPIAYGGGDENLYRYVGNSPTNAVDPSGLFKELLDRVFGAVKRAVARNPWLFTPDSMSTTEVLAYASLTAGEMITVGDDYWESWIEDKEHYVSAKNVGELIAGVKAKKSELCADCIGTLEITGHRTDDGISIEPTHESCGRLQSLGNPGVWYLLWDGAQVQKRATLDCLMWFTDGGIAESCGFPSRRGPIVAEILHNYCFS
ncbi:MAG TPA: RHS repeat-associated core domain-containing protein, partial [Thermoguttaceae bacterium]|nr:RHS repeat-associated core domain-containing protein [Thermoguttaceae bacterium]